MDRNRLEIMCISFFNCLELELVYEFLRYAQKLVLKHKKTDLGPYTVRTKDIRGTRVLSYFCCCSSRKFHDFVKRPMKADRNKANPNKALCVEAAVRHHKNSEK